MIEAFKLLGRIVLEGGEAVLKTLTNIGNEADQTGGNMSTMGNRTSQAAQSINQAGQAARTTSGALNETRSAAQNMGQTMNTAGQAAYNNITRLPKELRNISRHLGEMDAQTKATFASFSQIYMDQRTKMQGFNRDLLQNKMNWISLGVEAKNYQGTTAQFMDQVRRLGAEEKKINDARIKANELGKIAILQQVGTMMNLSTQATKISQIYTGMHNPLLNVNQAGLSVANSLNRMALMGSAAALALKQLGPNANMKELQDRIGVISQGIMRMQFVAIGAAAVLIGFTAAMVNAAKGTRPRPN